MKETFTLGGKSLLGKKMGGSDEKIGKDLKK